MPGRVSWIVGPLCLLALAACGGSTGANSPPITRRTTTTPAVVNFGRVGPTAELARKLAAAKLGCEAYEDIAQAQNGALGGGLLDVGNCTLGHLAVFATTTARDRWVKTQLSTFHMRGCAVGRIWAVCLFPTAPASRQQVETVLAGTATS